MCWLTIAALTNNNHTNTDFCFYIQKWLQNTVKVKSKRKYAQIVSTKAKFRQQEYTFWAVVVSKYTAMMMNFSVLGVALLKKVSNQFTIRHCNFEMAIVNEMETLLEGGRFYLQNSGLAPNTKNVFNREMYSCWSRSPYTKIEEKKTYPTPAF